MKRCLYCAEEIHDEVAICGFCNRQLAPSKVRTGSGQATAVAPLPWGGVAAIGGIGLVLPFLAIAGEQSAGWLAALAAVFTVPFLTHGAIYFFRAQTREAGRRLLIAGTALTAAILTTLLLIWSGRAHP